MPYYRDSSIYRDSSYYRDSVPLQISVPTGDKFVDGWYTEPLYSKINELSPDTSNYIHTSSGALDVQFQVWLSGIKRPSARYPGDTKISVQYRASTYNPYWPLSMRVSLVEGVTVIKQSDVNNIFNTDWATVEIPLTFEERDRIQNWSGLYLQIISQI